MKILTIGEALFDRIEGNYYIGGAPFNYSAHLARLGAEVTLITRVGEDELGARLIESAETLGINTSLIQCDETYPTSIADVYLDEQKVPDFTIYTDCAWDFIEFDELPADIFDTHYDLAYFGVLAQRAERSHKTHKKILDKLSAGRFFFDSNIRKDDYTFEKITQSLEHASILKLNEDECALFAEFFYQDYGYGLDGSARCLIEDYALEMLCLTRGAQGATIFTAEGDEHTIRPESVFVVDTTGAGDAFAAGFSYGILLGAPPEKAAQIAVRLASFVTMYNGGVPDYNPKDVLKNVL